MICDRRSFGKFPIVPLWFGWIGLFGEWANGGLVLPKKFNEGKRYCILFERKTTLFELDTSDDIGVAFVCICKISPRYSNWNILYK